MGGAASRVPSRQYRGPRSDASSEHAASEEPARWHRATEPSHAKKSKGDPTTALSKNGHDTFTSSGTSRGGAWHGSHWSHTVARCTLTRQGTTTRGGTAYIVLAVALRPRRGPRRTRAKVLEVLLHSWRAQTTAENIVRGSLGRHRRPRDDSKSPRAPRRRKPTWRARRPSWKSQPAGDVHKEVKDM